MGSIAQAGRARVTRASILFNPDTALAPPLDHVIEATPSVGVSVALAPVQDDAGIEEAAAAQAREAACCPIPDFALQLPASLPSARFC
jgi:hypothetical protein